MVSGKAVVINEKGLHIKPAGKMSSIALSYPCMAYLVIREYRVNAKSVLGILSAQVKKGEEIEVVCDGEGEEDALRDLLAAVEAGFDLA